MALKYPIWVNHISNLSDARYCAGMGVDVLCFQQSSTLPHYIDQAQVYAIMGWLSGVDLALEIDQDTDLEQVIAMNPTYIVVSNPELLSKIPLTIKSVLKYNTIDSNVDFHLWSYLMLSENSEIADAFLFNVPLIIDIPLTPFQADELLGESKTHFIALRGSKEEKAGVKNFDELADFLEAIEID